ncbi:MAG TPA: hypothetical protein PKW55_00125 [Spirochaetota bacterium]|mgnify:CR=1 FL=1|nr:hypothetical protein [Spirochaetota bacterium]HOM37764.1 hypothetical protein [Spirochaetota bacterium]HPQ49359.1 hypothetical protein [Spirochaetota bacterium]
MKKALILFSFFLFMTLLYSEDDRSNFFVIYSHESLSDIASFFVNDISLVYKDRQISSILSYDNLDTIIKNYKEGFYIVLSSKNNITVNYFYDGMVKKNLKYNISREVSIKAIKKIFGYNVPLVKSRVVIFDFYDKSLKDEKIDGFSTVFSFNIADILIKSNNFNVKLANTTYKDNVFKNYDVFIYGSYIKSGEDVTVYSYVYDNNSGNIKFSFKDSFKFNKKDYIYFLDKISSKISTAVIKEYKPSPPKVVFREKYISVERKEDEPKKEEIREEEEKNITDSLSIFSGFNIEGVKPKFVINKYYSDKGVFEIGFYSGSYINGFNSGKFDEFLNLSHFINIFFINSFYVGYRVDFNYYFTTKNYNLKAFITPGVSVKLGKNLFLSFGLLFGYSKNGVNYYHYGNELCFKIAIFDSALFSLGTYYIFVTDMSKIYFNDVFKPYLGFSVYF